VYQYILNISNNFSSCCEASDINYFLLDKRFCIICWLNRLGFAIYILTDITNFLVPLVKYLDTCHQRNKCKGFIDADPMERVQIERLMNGAGYMLLGCSRHRRRRSKPVLCALLLMDMPITPLLLQQY